MSLLPQQVPEPGAPLGYWESPTGERIPVVIEHNWWLLLFNFAQLILGDGSGLPADALQDLATADTDAADSDAIALAQPLANLAVLAGDDAPTVQPSDMANALLLAQDNLLPDPPALAQPFASVAPGGSPFIWTAPFAGYLSVAAAAGTVSALTLARQGAAVPVPAQSVVNRQQFVAGGSAAANVFTTAAFTPGNGNYLIAFTWVSDGGTGAITISGTGTWSLLTPPGHFSDGGTEYYSIGFNSRSSEVSQTVTVTGSGTASQAVCAGVTEYEGVGAVAGSTVLRASPGTGVGALLGTAVVVPPGAVLLVYAHNDSTQTGTITPTAGTVLESDGAGNTTVEYAGTGASITPAFTVTAGGAAFMVQQVLLTPQMTTALIPVCRGDTVTVTYSSAPTLNFIPWSSQ